VASEGIVQFVIDNFGQGGEFWAFQICMSPRNYSNTHFLVEGCMTEGEVWPFLMNRNLFLKMISSEIKTECVCCDLLEFFFSVLFYSRILAH
jgi:hypothetical protein